MPLAVGPLQGGRRRANYLALLLPLLVAGCATPARADAPHRALLPVLFVTSDLATSEFSDWYLESGWSIVEQPTHQIAQVSLSGSTAAYSLARSPVYQVVPGKVPNFSLRAKMTESKRGLISVYPVWQSVNMPSTQLFVWTVGDWQTLSQDLAVPEGAHAFQIEVKAYAGSEEGYVAGFVDDLQITHH